MQLFSEHKTVYMIKFDNDCKKHLIVLKFYITGKTDYKNWKTNNYRKYQEKPSEKTGTYEGEEK